MSGGWVWLAAAALLIGAGLALLALARRRNHPPEGARTGEAIPGLLRPSEGARLFEAGPKPPDYRPGQQEHQP